MGRSAYCPYNKNVTNVPSILTPMHDQRSCRARTAHTSGRVASRPRFGRGALNRTVTSASPGLRPSSGETVPRTVSEKPADPHTSGRVASHPRSGRGAENRRTTSAFPAQFLRIVRSAFQRVPRTLLIRLTPDHASPPHARARCFRPRFERGALNEGITSASRRLLKTLHWSLFRPQSTSARWRLKRSPGSFPRRRQPHPLRFPHVRPAHPS